MGKDETQQKFKLASAKKTAFDMVPKSIQQYMQFMDYKLRKQFKSFTLLSLCGADRGNFMVENNFQRAFATMTLEQKTEYFKTYVDNVGKALKADNQMLREQNANIESVVIPLKVGKGGKSLSEAQVSISNLRAQSQGKLYFDIDFGNYLLRKSKKRQELYVLQAIRNSDPQTIRFSFLSPSDQQKYLPIIKQSVNQANFKNIDKQVRSLQKKHTTKQNSANQIKLKMNSQLDRNSSKLNINNNSILNSRKRDTMNRSVIEDIVKSRQDQQIDEELTELIAEQNQQLQRLELARKDSQGTPQFKNNRNIFRIILPHYSLKNMSSLHHYGTIYQSSQSQFYVYQNMRHSDQFKMQLAVRLPLQIVCKAIQNVQLYKHWHPEIQEGQIKLKISSENSCILYEKTKAFSEWHRARDYILLTHQFRLKNSYVIIQKSIQNLNYVPFHTITRGNFQYIVWRIEPELATNSNPQQKSQPKCRVFMQVKVDHGGLLNRKHHKEYTLRFMKGFEFLESFFKQQQNQKKLKDILGFEWAISEKDTHQNNDSQGRIDRKNSTSVGGIQFQQASEISAEVQDNEQVFYSIEDLSEQQKQNEEQEQKQQKEDHQIQPQVIATQNQLNSQVIQNNQGIQQIQLDSEGLVILPKKYLKRKHPNGPSADTNKKPMELPYQNIVLKDHWVIEKSGGLKLVNQVKIDAQNSVIKFVMKTLKKNIFSGKGLNISLPVQIFNVDSNLQRICQGLSLGPQFLERAAKTNDKLERFKYLLAFGLSNTVIYVDVQKPFNPILGQTYQGFIRGCPIYAEQISHHPPITSIYFIGRGYKIYGNFQGKIKVHMNSGEGSNQGYYHVVFDDGHHIICTTPPAELSGLAVGDRKFNVKGAGYYIDEQNGYFCELIMEQRGGGIMSKKKKRDFVDQVDGDIIKVKPDFFRKFMQEPDIEKKPSPGKDDIIEKVGEAYGRWPLFLKIDDNTIYDVVKDVPDKMIHDIYPLNSNSNYREDLFYRKKNDLSRSQIQKQRLEVLQRGDRKLRQKLGGKSH